MSQSKDRVVKTVLQLNKTGYSTWNLTEKGPKFNVLAIVQHKLSSANHDDQHFSRLWPTFKKIPSYTPESVISVA